MGAALARQTLGSAYAVNSPPRYHDNGSGGKLLRPENQVANAAVPAAISGGEAPTEAEFLALRTLSSSMQAALIAAGIMKDA